MKLALAGCYGHCNAMIASALACADVDVVAVARYGADDSLKIRHVPGVDLDALAIYNDWRTMLDEVQPDIVGAFMPFSQNAAVSLEAARRGCHIVGEKPLATTLKDLAALRQAVTDAGVQVAAFLPMRGSPAYQAAYGIVQAGRIGQPILATAQKSYPFKSRDEFFKTRRSYGGSIPWVAIHAIDYVHYCTGLDFVRVAAMQSNRAHPTHPGCEDNGGILLEMTGGSHAVITFDYLRPWADGVQRRHGDDRLRIAGSDGIVEVTAEGGEVRLMTPETVETVELPPAADLFGRFVDTILGRGEPLITTADSLRMTEVALLARLAADERRIVELL